MMFSPFDEIVIFSIISKRPSYLDRPNYSVIKSGLFCPLVHNDSLLHVMFPVLIHERKPMGASGKRVY